MSDFESWTRRIDMLISDIILMALKCLQTTLPRFITLSFLTGILGDIQPLKAQLPGSLTRIVINILEWKLCLKKCGIWASMNSSADVLNTEWNFRQGRSTIQKFLHSGKTGQCRSRASPHASLMDMSVSLKIAEVGSATKSLN